MLVGGVGVNSLCQQGRLFALSVNRHSVLKIINNPHPCNAQTGACSPPEQFPSCPSAGKLTPSVWQSLVAIAQAWRHIWSITVKTDIIRKNTWQITDKRIEYALLQTARKCAHANILFKHTEFVMLTSNQLYCYIAQASKLIKVQMWTC